MKGHRLNLTHPVNKKAKLNRGVVEWWKVLPGRAQGGGEKFRGLMRRVHGTLVNAPTWSGALGRPGGWGALEFNGANNVNFGTPANLTTLDTMTVAVWVQVLSTATFRNDLFSQWAGSQYHWLLASSVGGLSDFAFYVESALTGGSFPNATGGTVVTGAWNRVVGTYDRSNLRLYQNGIQVASTAFTSALTSTSSQAVLAGASGDNSATCRLDDLKLLSRAWSAQEVAYDYQVSRLSYPEEFNWIPTARYFLPTPVEGGAGPQTIDATGIVLSAQSSAAAPTLSAAASSQAPVALSSPASVVVPAISAANEPQTIVVSAVGSALSSVAAPGVESTLSVAPDVAAGQSSAAVPSVSPGAASQQPDALASQATAVAPSLQDATTTLTPDALASQSTATAPAVVSNVVAVSQTSTAQASAVAPLIVVVGGTVGGVHLGGTITRSCFGGTIEQEPSLGGRVAVNP